MSVVAQCAAATVSQLSCKQPLQKKTQPHNNNQPFIPLCLRSVQAQKNIQLPSITSSFCSHMLTTCTSHVNNMLIALCYILKIFYVVIFVLQYFSAVELSLLARFRIMFPSSLLNLICTLIIFHIPVHFSINVNPYL